MVDFVPAPLRSLAVALVAVIGLLSLGSGCTAAPDPIELLRESVATVESAPSSSVDFGVKVRVVMGEEIDEQRAGYVYQGAEGGRFSFGPAEGDAAAQEGILVKSNGAVTLTHLISRNKHMLEENVGGIATFVRSPLATGLGNGLGGLAMSFLSPSAMDDLINEITASEYLGIEEIEGVSYHHARYTVEDSLEWDAWIASEGAPLVYKVSPNLSEMKASSPAAQKFDNFDYTIDFDYTNWNTDAGLGEEDFAISEPVGSFFVESFFRRPSEAPHPLLGQPAPAFELSDLEGEPVNLADHLGRDVVLLDFWATWCPPCVAALPDVTEVTASFADRGVVLYAVNQQESAEKVAAFLEEKELETPVLLDADGVGSVAYSVEGLPTSILIGRDGNVQMVHVGFSGNLKSQLSSELEALVSGENLAAEKVAEWQAEEAKRAALIAKLRSLLDN